MKMKQYEIAIRHSPSLRATSHIVVKAKNALEACEIARHYSEKTSEIVSVRKKGFKE